MDNLTHSMLGAVLGQTGLKRKTGLAMPALIIGANIPDIDATCAFLGTQSLAMRRGITHGPLGLIILPLLLTGLLLFYDRWQGQRGRRPDTRLPVQPKWLLALAFIGTLSHPALDWLNSYGIRLLEPFSSRWFYGDVLFIIDPVIWALLIGGFIWSRRAEKRDRGNYRSRAVAIALAACAYVAANGAVTRVAEDRASRWVHSHTQAEPAQVVANPVPLTFWRRDMLWRSADGRYGSFPFDLFRPDEPARLGETDRTGMENPRVAALAANDRDAAAFLFWSRMPIARFDSKGTLLLTDQRFANRMTRGSFTIAVPTAYAR